MTAHDLELARKIVNKRTSWVGPMGTMRDNIAQAVAEGVALGRRQGIEQAAKRLSAHFTHVIETEGEDAHRT